MGYRGKVEEQGRARELRAQGWTLAEICAELGVSKASASLWCRDVEVDEALYEQRRRARGEQRASGLAQRTPNKLQRRKAEEIEQARRDGIAAIGELSDRDLMIGGLMLYAGEGAKGDGCVKLANTDARMMAFFCAWLRRFFDIDESRLRVHLYLHEGLDLDAARQHWSDITGIPVSQFIKPYRAKPRGDRKQTRHPFGCPSVSYSCSRTHRQILGLMDALLGSSLLDPAPRARLPLDPG